MIDIDKELKEMKHYKVATKITQEDIKDFQVHHTFSKEHLQLNEVIGKIAEVMAKANSIKNYHSLMILVEEE